MIRDKSAKKIDKAGKEPAKPPKGVIAVAPPSFRRERGLIKRGVWPVAGCDEAGRGPLAGPVVAAAVVLDPKRIPKGIDNSKRLTAERREELFEEICATSSFAVAFASPARIDRDNILRASLWALARAVGALPEMPQACVRRRPRQDRRALRLRCGDRRRRHCHVDRRSLDHRQSDARPPDERVGAGLSGLRLRKPQGLCRSGTSRGAGPVGPSIHHRRFFAPVVAARRKHYPETVEETVEPDLFTVDSEINSGISATI